MGWDSPSKQAKRRDIKSSDLSPFYDFWIGNFSQIAIKNQQKKNSKKGKVT